MNNGLLQEVMNRLDGIGQAISNGSKAAFEILVRQKFAEGIIWSSIDILFLLIGIFLAIFLSVVLTKAAKEEEKEEYTKAEEDKATVLSFLWCVGAVFSVICLLVAITQLPNNLLHVLNPQYYAIKDIISAIKH